MFDVAPVLKVKQRPDTRNVFYDTKEKYQYQMAYIASLLYN